MKNKSSSNVKMSILSVVILSLIFIFIGLSANANQVFLFSDDLSAQFNINQSQTTAKFVSGRFYTADDSVSSAVVSKIVANPFKMIISARLDVSVSVPSGTTIVYYLSNNNGLRWTQVNPGYTYTFDSVGNELRWRVVIVRESPFLASAYLDNINITYTVSDSLTPSPSINSNQGSLSTVIYGNGGDLNAFVCGILASIGSGCGSPQKTATPAYGQPNSRPAATLTPAPQEPSSQPNRQANVGNNLQASIANVTVKRTASDDEVILVKVPVSVENQGSSTVVGATNDIKLKQTLGLSTNDAIFEIIRGQKHFIPTIDIFFDYGFDLSAVQSITHKDLEPFPRTKLVKVNGDKKKTYYITEGYMIRLIPNKNVFESYGDREEDIITISTKEFNFYPRNQYVFLENPLNAAIYQIVDNGTKRYVVPQVMKRLRMKQEQIAPINQIQLDVYQNSQPIIF